MTINKRFVSAEGTANGSRMPNKTSPLSAATVADMVATFQAQRKAEEDAIKHAAALRTYDAAAQVLAA